MPGRPRVAMFTQREDRPGRRTGRFAAPTMDDMQLHEAPDNGSRALPGHHPDAMPAGEAE